MSPNIFSLGAWCRPAWQIRRYFDCEQAAPFDWNITSYRALMAFLHPDFSVQQQLQIANCFVNELGSVTDDKSGMVYHHDLSAAAVGGSRGSLFMRDDPATLALLDTVRDKFAFLYQRFHAQCRSRPAVFIRWIRGGHPDGEWPQAFQDERPHALFTSLLSFCGHRDIRLLYVVSHTTSDPAAVSGCDLTFTSYGANACLNEAACRFREENWTGDDDAWSALFARVSEGWLGLA